MTPSDLKATSELYWVAALLTAVLDAAFIFLLARRVGRSRFRQLGWSVGGVATAFWVLMWAAMMAIAWDLAYRYVFSAGTRWLVPPSYGLLFGGAALLTWWLALRLPGNPIATFCLLGGLASLPGHLFAIYARGILEIPMLRGVAPASALAFGIFEFVFYWCVILSVALLVRHIWDGGRGLTVASHDRAVREGMPRAG